MSVLKVPVRLAVELSDTDSDLRYADAQQHK